MRSFEEEVPSGGSQAGDTSQTSCPIVCILSKSRAAAAATNLLRGSQGWHSNLVSRFRGWITGNKGLKLTDAFCVREPRAWIRGDYPIDEGLGLDLNHLIALLGLFQGHCGRAVRRPWGIVRQNILSPGGGLLGSLSANEMLEIFRRECALSPTWRLGGSCASFHVRVLLLFQQPTIQHKHKHLIIVCWNVSLVCYFKWNITCRLLKCILDHPVIICLFRPLYLISLTALMWDRRHAMGCPGHGVLSDRSSSPHAWHNMRSIASSIPGCMCLSFAAALSYACRVVVQSCSASKYYLSRATCCVSPSLSLHS